MTHDGRPLDSSSSTGSRPTFGERLRKLIDSPVYLAVRPPELIANLPARYRWEFTRRHPYYLVAWEDVRQDSLGEPPVRLLDELTQAARAMCLSAIGVAGMPVNPALEFDDAAFGGNDPFIISGACQPVTLRALSLLLMNSLPAADRAAVGAILQSSGTREHRDVPGDKTWQAWGTEQLRNLDSRALNSYPLRPLFHLYLGSSQRTILDDVTEQLRLRQQGQTPARATRPETLETYLSVWDQREGWTGSGYRYQNAKRFTKIAGARAGRRQISTAFDRYRRAFELIVGRPYNFDLWLDLFGFISLNRYLNPTTEGETRRRRPRRRVVRQQRRRQTRSPATEEVAGPGSNPGEATAANLGADVPVNYCVTDLATDVRGLIDGGARMTRLLSGSASKTPHRSPSCESGITRSESWHRKSLQL